MPSRLPLPLPFRRARAPSSSCPPTTPAPSASPPGPTATHFTEYTGGRIARITTDGEITELGTPISASFPQSIALGPDGAMWFAENGANRLGRVTTAGRVTKLNLPTHDSGIVGGPDGTLWFAPFNVGTLLKVELAAAQPTRTATGTPAPTGTPPPGSTATTTPELLGCAGDCGDDCEVTIDDLIKAVNFALDSATPDTCPNVDRDRDGTATINELIRAVSSTLVGCPQ